MEPVKLLSIEEGCKLILNYDPDMAREINGVGFNKIHGPIVRDMLSRDGSLSHKQKYFLWKTLRYYKGQLMNLYSIDFETQIEKIEPPVETSKRRLTIVDNQLRVKFDYNPRLIGIVKELFKEKHFDNNTTEWVVGITEVDLENKVQTLVDKYEFDFSEEMSELLKKLIKEQKEKKEITGSNPDHILGLYEVNGAIKLKVLFPYNKNIINKIQELPYQDRNYSVRDKYWLLIPNVRNIGFIISLKKEFGFICASKETSDFLNRIYLENQNIEEKKKENLTTSSSFDSTLEVKGLKGTLRPFQKAGVEYIIKNERLIVGDEMGLGKTIEAIAAVHHKGAYPALICCPNSLKYNWKREWEKWTGAWVEIINSDDSEEEAKMKIFEYSVLIGNYNTIAKYVSILKTRQWNAVVMDESHYLKNAKTNRADAVSKVVKATKPILRIALTGTAITNKPSELIAQLNILERLDDFGGFWNFVNRYCAAKRGQWGLDISGASNIPELHTQLRSICYIRRNKKDVLSELPDKQRTVVEVDINNRTEYRKAEQDLINYLKGETISLEKLENYYKQITKDKEEVISFSDLDEGQMLQLRINYIAKRVDSAEAAEHLVRINTLKQLVAKGKLEAVKEWIDDFIESGEKLVVFVNHTFMAEELASYYKCKMITGAVKVEDRQAAVDDFQDNPNTKLIVLNIKAGGVGITLTAASNVAIIELPWTPTDLDQAEDRLHRIGQKNAVTAWYLLGKNTIDIDIDELIANKRVVTEGVNAGKFEGEDVKIVNELVARLLSK